LNTDVKFGTQIYCGKYYRYQPSYITYMYRINLTKSIADLMKNISIIGTDFLKIESKYDI